MTENWITKGEVWTVSGLLDGWEFEHKGKEFEVQVKGSLIFNDAALSVKAAIDGCGVIYNAAESIREEVASGQLELVLKPFAAISAGYYLYYPRQSRTMPKLRAFIEHVKGQS